MNLHQAALAASLVLAAHTSGQVVDPFYATDYSMVNLGSVPEVPINYGGITFLAGDPNTLLIGGAANGPNGAIYSVQVTRDGDNNITGFAGPATVFAACPNIDGGLCYGPDGVLFATGYPNHVVHQFLPGATSPSRTISLSGITGSVGSLMFVPPGFAGEGRLKVASYSAGTWHDAQVAPDGSGTFDISITSPAISIGGGPEGFVYVRNTNPLFINDSILVSEYSLGQVSSYEIDANGDPIVNTRRAFITGLSGAEGAALDPLTGQFMFSTFGGFNQVIVVRGFVPTPECDPDVNCDGVPDQDDVACIILAVAGDMSCYCQADPDFNGDGVPDQGDVADVILTVAGAPCP